jgi:hypothetical protein
MISDYLKRAGKNVGHEREQMIRPVCIEADWN